MWHSRRICMDYLPEGPPFSATLAWGLFLDRIAAPGWAWGAMGLIVVWLWVIYFYCRFTCTFHHPAKV